MPAPTVSPAGAAGAEFQELPRRQLILTLAGLMLSLLLAALDQTIVGTAMPRVIAELQGFDHYAWVTTAYLLTSTAILPIAGKLSDLYGRKYFLIGGAAFFVLTSALCGIAQSMTQLIVYRGLQGIGGGILMAMVFTGVSAIFPPAKRARMQGLFGGVFGFSSIVGPLLGGYLTDNLSWRWVFYVNLPVGLFALAVLWLSFPNVRPSRSDRPIDFLGAATLVAGVVPLLLALSWGGNDLAWTSPQVIGLLTLAAVMTALFVRVEARAAEPIIPLSLFKNPIVAVATVALSLMAVGMFGSILFVPLFVQGVIGTDATRSGTVMMPMMMMMLVTSIIAGQVISRTGRYKLVGLFGLAVMAAGMFLLSRMGPETSFGSVVFNLILIGVGLGPTMPVFTLAAQNAVRFDQLGVVTSLTQFARSIGGTLGAAVFGSLLTNRFGPALRAALPPQAASEVPADVVAQLQNPQVLLNPEASSALRQGVAQLGPQGAQVFDALLGAIRTALAAALQDVFLAGTLMTLAGAVVVFFLKEIPLKKTYAHATAPARPAAALVRTLEQDAIPSAPPVGGLRARRTPAGNPPLEGASSG